MGLIVCYFTDFNHTCGHRSFQSIHNCATKNCPDMDYSSKASNDHCSYCMLWDRVDKGEAKSPASTSPPIMCSETTVQHTCGNISVRNVHQCGREMCERLEYMVEDSEELCGLCMAVMKLHVAED